MRQSLCTLLLLAGVAGASAPLVAQEGAYARVQLGQAQLDFVDDEDVAVGATLGYRFTPNFGAEIGYQDLGSGRFGGATIGGAIPEIDSRSFTVGLDARYPLEAEDRGFFLGGRFGVHWYKNDGVANVTGLAVGFDTSDNDLYFGAGVGYAFNDRFDVALNWTRFNSDIEVPGSGNRAAFAVSNDVDVVALAAEFRF